MLEKIFPTPSYPISKSTSMQQSNVHNQCLLFLTDIYRACGDTNFIFKCWYNNSHKWANRTSERCYHDKKIKFVYPRNHAMFCLLYWNWWNSYDEIFACSEGKNDIFTVNSEDINYMLYFTGWEVRIEKYFIRTDQKL